MAELAVSWRRVAAVLAAVVVAVTGIVVVVRADGFTPVEATVPRATRWFVDPANGWLVLADGFAGRALARVDPGEEGNLVGIAQGPAGAAVFDRSGSTTREIDQRALRLGPPRTVDVLASPGALTGFSQAGFVAVDLDEGDAVLVPSGGDTVPFEVRGAGVETRIAPDGSVWTVDGSSLLRISTTTATPVLSGLADLRFTLVGNDAFVFDPARNRVRLGDGEWVRLPATIDESEIVLQEPGPAAGCGWVAANDNLWCVGDADVVRSAEVPGLDVDGADRLAIAGDAAALVRARRRTIERFDWREGVVYDGGATVPATADLDIAVSADLIWVDDLAGPIVWAIHPWGIHAIEKDRGTVFGESGDPVDDQEVVGDVALRPNGDPISDDYIPPDDNGIDDPPEAVDDPVTARTGPPVRIAVTANDHDPDGEAIAVVDVGETSQSGVVEIEDASTVVYRPADGFVGIDTFEYTIADGNGTEASATVTVELLPLDGPNQPPRGSPDTTETGPGRAVVIDVLANDVDPERDPLRIDSFELPAAGGELIEMQRGPSGLPALRYTPPDDLTGPVSFTYRPADFKDAVGDAVEVEIAIAPGDENRPPEVRPDAIRLRRDVPRTLAVLNNDRDPDGDRLLLSILEGTVPQGIDAQVRGDTLEIIARAGAGTYSPFQYQVTDRRGGEGVGSVLVVVLSDSEPNQPPTANADAAGATVGETTIIDVLDNDSDPDGDDIFVVDVGPDRDGTAGDVRIVGNAVQYTPPPLDSEDEGSDRFVYTITDGNDHFASAVVSVTIRPEPLPEVPYALDDTASTYVDEPVTFDPVVNDGDPSGVAPTITADPACASGGRAVLNTDGDVTYTPPPGRTGVFLCTYTIANRQGATDTAEITVVVELRPRTNQPPEVGSIPARVATGGTIDIDLLRNATDPDGDDADLQVVGMGSVSPTAGTAVRSGSTLTFTAGATEQIVSIPFQVADADGAVTPGRVNITIFAEVPEQEAPDAADDRYQVEKPITSRAFPVLENDTDPDGDPAALRVQSVRVTQGQGTAVAQGQTVLVTFEPTFVGDIRAVYTVVDPDGLTDEATVTVTVREPPNRPPDARDDATEIVNGGSVSLDLSVNDTDPENAPLTYTLVSGPEASRGTATLSPSGILTFVAAPGVGGVAQMTYRVSDGELTDQATVRITVQSCAAAPASAPDVELATPYRTPIDVDLTRYTATPIVFVDQPLGQAKATYTPPEGKNDNLVVRYDVRNACGQRASGFVIIDVNQDPNTSPYETSIGRNATLTIPISNFASDDEPLTITALDAAPPWLTISADRKSLVANPAGAAGTAAATATVADPGGLTGRAPIRITLQNTPPVAAGDTVVIGSGVVVFEPLANDSDPDGDAISLLTFPASITFPNGGTGSVTAVGGGRLRIDPGSGQGTASFTYTIADALGAASQPATVTVVVNRAPVANDLTVEIPAGPAVAFALPVSDPDGDPVTIELLDSAAPFVVTVSGLTVTAQIPRIWRPPLTVPVTYRATDSRGASDTGELTLVLVEAARGP